MSKRERCRKVRYKITGPSGRWHTFWARTVAHAVKQFRQVTGETIQADESGGYRHTGVEVLG